MTAAERTQQRVIRDLQVRVGELERENARLRALVKSHSTLRRKAVDQGRYLAGVLIANGFDMRRTR